MVNGETERRGITSERTDRPTRWREEYEARECVEMRDRVSRVDREGQYVD